MTENEAIEILKTDSCIECIEDADSPIVCEYGACRVAEATRIAIKALEEVQRWHTSEINPEIKNVFANTSTQICHNCDHKDEYIVELEAEMEQYQTLEKRLTEMFGDRLSLETVVDEMERVLKEPGNPHPVNAKILTYEDAKAWEEYKTIGTPEECLAAMEKQTAKRPLSEGYGHQCPICDNYFDSRDWKSKYCGRCGQKLDWSDEE